MNMQSSDEYEENISSLPEILSGDIRLSPKNSSLTSGLFPKAGNMGKLMRRRSRASKKAPTTLLNANTNSFRALVQQFTGYHSSPLPFGTYKGPIYLNFARHNARHNDCSEKSHEAPQQRGQRQEDQSLYPHEESDHQSVFSCPAAAAATPTDNPDELFAPSLNYDSRPDPLTSDEFDMEISSLKEEPGNGDYYALPGTWRDDDFWRH